MSRILAKAQRLASSVIAEKQRAQIEPKGFFSFSCSLCPTQAKDVPKSRFWRRGSCVLGSFGISIAKLAPKNVVPESIALRLSRIEKIRDPSSQRCKRIGASKTRGAAE